MPLDMIYKNINKGNFILFFKIQTRLVAEA